MSYKPEKITKQENPLISTRIQNLNLQKPYALESAGTVHGIVVINDSASTTLELVASSLLAFEKPVVWMLEANANHPDFTALGEIMREKVKTVIAIGPEADKIHETLWAWNGLFISANSWEEGVDMGLMAAKKDDTLLFSPGCRANEPFRNLRERGEYLNQLIEIKRQTKT